MRGAISTTVIEDQDEPAIRLQFRYQDPQRARQVTEALASRLVEAAPETFQLAEPANLPACLIPTTFATKTSAAGLAGGLLIGAPIALVLYWRRRK